MASIFAPLIPALIGIIMSIPAKNWTLHQRLAASAVIVTSLVFMAYASGMLPLQCMIYVLMYLLIFEVTTKARRNRK